MLIAATALFLILERAFPGRDLPVARGWYARVLLLNFIQIVISFATAKLWIHVFAGVSFFKFSVWNNPFAEGFAGWFIGTFFFYWWHRIRHLKPFWLIFHQVHHSPSRIEVLTSFYKHPIEIFSDAVLTAIVLYPVLGCSLYAIFWYNFFAAVGEYFYHANIRTPRWLRYLIQTPELHSVHHQYDVHRFNFGDIPVWDRIFGTYKDTTEFVHRCGFPRGAEAKLVQMLFFKDVYREQTE